MKPFPSAKTGTEPTCELTRLWQEHTLGARRIIFQSGGPTTLVSILNSFYMLTVEVHSLKAISSLESEFPYAATLLIYVVLERCLKLHLLQNRKTLTEFEVALNEPVGSNKTLKLVDFKNHNDADFVEQFLIKCTLGALEIIYKVSGRKYSTQRNKVFHSNFYVTDQLGQDYASRDAANRQYLQIAKEHLIEASGIYFHQRIIVSNGVLQFES